MNEKLKNVLVIDDEEEIVNAAKRMLERSGYFVNTALNGKQGIDRITQHKPDVIITDIIMPVMDGYEFYKHLKNETLTSRIPVIILTARPNMEDAFRALGVQGFVTKPFTVENLVEKIERLGERDTPMGPRGSLLIAGSDEYTLSQMSVLLKDDGYHTQTAENSADIIVKALEEALDFIFLDVYMKEIPSRETIKALRSFHKLDNVKIILYTSFTPDDQGTFNHIDYLQEAKQACMKAGADHFIGRFSNVNFIDNLNSIRNS